MKITKYQLKQIIEEELSRISEYGGAISNVGGVAANLGGVREPSDDIKNAPDSIIQSKATEFFMSLGLDSEVVAVIVDNVATADLSIVMEKIPKLWTAQQDEEY
jgi:hypothetical protein